MPKDEKTPTERKEHRRKHSSRETTNKKIRRDPSSLTEHETKDNHQGRYQCGPDFQLESIRRWYADVDNAGTPYEGIVQRQTPETAMNHHVDATTVEDTPVVGGATNNPVNVDLLCIGAWIADEGFTQGRR